jgi:hydroxyacylglutathione hydrolase
MSLSRFVKFVCSVGLRLTVDKTPGKSAGNFLNVGFFSTPITPIIFRNSSLLQSESGKCGKMHSEIKKVEFPNLSIITIPATQDNFMYLIVDKTSGEATVVDPVEPQRVLQVVDQEQVTLKSVLTTHHHWDHAGGNQKLVDLSASERGNQLEVYGGDSRIEALTKPVGQGDKIQVGNLVFDCLHTPCHTTGHICYFLRTNDSNVQKPAVFTGDTLFIAGCGRFFEGTPPQMYDALITKLSSLPDDTLVFCGHEYTVNNLKFALSVEPNNADAVNKLIWAEAQRAAKKPTVPSTIGEEKLINPFMRVTLPAVQQLVGATDSINCMGTVRTMKDNFRA